MWTVTFSTAGYLFGGLPFVKQNFALVALAIVLLSLAPLAWELRHAGREESGGASGATGGAEK